MSPRTAAILFDVAVILALALTILSWWTWTGPVNWACLLQVRLFSAYAEKLTITGVGIVIAFLLTFPAYFLRELNGQETEDKLPRHITLLIWSLPFMLACFAIAAFTYPSTQIPAPTPLNAGQIRTGDFDSRYIRGDGIALAPVASGDNARDASLFVPVVDTEWKTGDPVHLIVSVPRARAPKEGPFTFTGMRFPRPVPGPALARLEKAGIDAHDVVLISGDGSPATWRRAYGYFLIFAGIAGAIAIGSASVLLWQSARSKSSPAVSRYHRSLQALIAANQREHWPAKLINPTPDQLKQLAALGLPENVLDLYQSGMIDGSELRIRVHGPENIVCENTELFPGIEVCPKGFIVIGSTHSGDTFALDLHSPPGLNGLPRVLYISHEKDWGKCTPAEIVAGCKVVAPSLIEFLEGAIDDRFSR